MESEGGVVDVGNSEGLNDNDGTFDGKIDDDGKDEGILVGIAVGC